MADLTKLLGEKLDGHTLTKLKGMAATLRGWAWAIRLAIGADDRELLEEPTSRSWPPLGLPGAL